MSSPVDPFEEFGFQKETPRIKSLVAAPAKGLVKGLQDLGAGNILTSGAIPESLGRRLLEQVLPTREALPEKILERAGRIAPLTVGGPGSIASRLLQVGLGTAGGQLAEEGGLGPTGQAIGEMAGLSIPSVAAAGKSLLRRGPATKMASGLTEPRAVGARFPKAATISPARQEKAISKLNEEASAIAKKSVEKHVPINKQIEQGVDFESKFEKGFGELKSAAEKANPEIDITPISKLMNETRKKYTGIPKLHPEALKIAKELRAFGNRPQTELGNLLKIYRSNNQKIKHIYETSRLTGRQKEYVNFLEDFNKSISQSFKNTLPKESAWVKQFEDLNREFKSFKDSQKTMKILEPFLGEKPEMGKINRLASDPKIQQRLSMSMGKEGGAEITQIAKDLKQAVDAIKKIPVRERKLYEMAFPVGFFVPGIGKFLGAGFTAAKVAKGARTLYGRLLTSPKGRKLYTGALKALIKKDLTAYRRAAVELKKMLGIKEKDEFEEFGFKD